MLNSKAIKKKLSKSGQINIAETVVSATIILVLAVSVAQLGSRVALSQETNAVTKIQDKAQQTLDLCQSLGYLRQLAYSNNPNQVSAYNYTFSLITANLPSSAQFSLIQKTINNTNDPYNGRILLGITPIPSGNLNIFSVSVLEAGYFDGSQIYGTAYVVTLIVALGGN